MEITYRSHKEPFDVLKKEYGAVAPEIGTEVVIGDNKYKVSNVQDHNDLKGLPYAWTVLIEPVNTAENDTNS